MRVLCIGNGSAFASAFAGFLHNEGADIFWLCPKKPDVPSSFSRHLTHFPFDAGDPNIVHVFRSVAPEVVVFWGAQAGPYEGMPHDQALRTMLSDLAHIVDLTDACLIPKLLFFSGEEVFGDGQMGQLTEESPCWPNTPRGEYLLHAERMLMTRAQGQRQTLLVARLSGVFGPQSVPEKTQDFALTALARAKQGEHVQASPDDFFTPTFLTDAVEGAYALVRNERAQSGVYHVSSGQPVSHFEFLQALLSPVTSEPVRVTERVASVCLSGEKLRILTGFVPRYDLEKGRRITREWAEKTNYAYARAAAKPAAEGGGARVKRGAERLYQAAKTLLENLLLLAIAALATYLCAQSAQLSRVDWFLLYVTAIAVMRGMQTATASALLAGTVWVLFALRAQSLFDIMLNSGTYVQLISLLAVALFVGQVCDRLRDRATSAEVEMQQRQKQYDDLLAIHEANVEIKSILETRLLNYGDSFATIYSVIAKLDNLEPQKVMQATLDVVQRVLHAGDVAIYMLNDGLRYARLEVATSPAARELGKTLTIADYPALLDALLSQEVYMNSKLMARYPQMMATVVLEDKPRYLLLLWGIAFENLSLSNRNLLAVVARLVASAVGRAHQYAQAVARDRYIKDTYIMIETAFEQTLATCEENRRQHDGDYVLLRIHPDSCRDWTLEDVSGRITPLIRDMDVLSKREDGTLVILLRNTSVAEAAVPMRRLAGKGIETEVIAL